SFSALFLSSSACLAAAESRCWFAARNALFSGLLYRRWGGSPRPASANAGKNKVTVTANKLHRDSMFFLVPRKGCGSDGADAMLVNRVPIQFLIKVPPVWIPFRLS